MPKKIFNLQLQLKKHSLKSTKFAVSNQEPKLWNEFLSNEEKKIESQYFKKRVKSKLLDIENDFHISKTLLFKINKYPERYYDF